MDGQTGQRDPQTYAIIGAAMEVHRVLGHGFLEAVYQEALANEFGVREIPYEREKALVIRYKDVVLGHPYRADFLCYSDIVIETKALSGLCGEHEAQLIHYLKATGIKRGLLLNFGASSLQHKRMVFGHA